MLAGWLAGGHNNTNSRQSSDQLYYIFMTGDLSHTFRTINLSHYHSVAKLPNMKDVKSPMVSHWATVTLGHCDTVTVWLVMVMVMMCYGGMPGLHSPVCCDVETQGRAGMWWGEQEEDRPPPSLSPTTTRTHQPPHQPPETRGLWGGGWPRQLIQHHFTRVAHTLSPPPSLSLPPSWGQNYSPSMSSGSSRQLVRSICLINISAS